ncbi:DUF2782 domain-containing protein [Noviherbaspirillum cavernae]|uniref:DUF2782 domain-containing protein n=1 Tax=Noviherbaspirillum cavernae TaxID=2320862 RepID=UPI0018F4A8CA|nr:DUF2782 domain-containing protein [Noviherbaspirillum cavernae]
MRLFKVVSIVTACIAACATSFPVNAQQPAGNAPPPPRLEPLEEGEAPAVTITRPDVQQETTTQTRARGGKVTEVKVNRGNNTYYLKPNDQAGSAAPGDAGGSTIRGAQWEVLNFDFGPAKEAKEAQAEATATTPLPPAAPASPAPQGK